ncbi:cytosine permease [Erwiniaceae bacterium BAC15a-03b]|uniref:Cytosine permease n=1 Tax=Winslowiella arboricola TaxID=2978220 RepID=A0A9J6PUK1_9GAMM|nr:cytosine permease [Winslowiella arboricola]MCU5773649.1 cytosine permease [Winslowiella arboricola]MCU5778452.1 cytosine permease [Winslowiella arboricola]
MGKLKQWFQGPQDITEAEAVEDYAVGRVPTHYRWPIPAIILVLLGNSTAMFWFSLGADMSYKVGWPTLLLPIAYMVVFATIIGSCIMKLASKEGLSLNLMTRGLGFGYMGSAFTSLIYAINFIFYFLFEGTIVSHAIANYAGVEVNSPAGIAIFAVTGLVAIWFVWKGMSSMQFLQTWGVPIFILLFGFCIWQLTHHYQPVGFSGWHAQGAVDSNALWLVMNMANGQIVFQGLMATDYGRFARPGVTHKGTATIMLGMLIPIVVVMLFGAFMAYTLMPHIEQGDAWALALDPGFVFPLIIALTGVLFAIITQIRINVLNLYSGSIALSNTMDMAFNYRPGRQWWMVLVWALGVIFYVFNILQYTGTFLSITGILTNTWVFIILADYFICRKVFRLAPTDFVEYRKEYLRMWNPSGTIALLVAVAIGAAGVLGLYPMVYASFIAMLVGPVIHVIISVATRGQYYFKTFPTDMPTRWRPSDAYSGPKPQLAPQLNKEAE